METWQIWFAAVPGLILFIFAIEQFTSEIRKVAGERFRSFILASTKSPPRSFALGAAVTALVQSSTAVAIITLGLVESGFISFSQSLAILLGANVGTTVTAQLVAFNITSFGPAFIVLGFLLRIFGGKYSFIGRPLFFFGLVFFSLGLISVAMQPLASDPAVLSYLSGLTSVPLAVAAGFILTNVFQSSGVFTGLVVLLAAGGLIGPSQSIPLILGSNIGTITPLIASYRLSLFARRAAVAQLVSNIAGVAIILPFLPAFIALVGDMGGSAAHQTANAHTIFNVIFSIVFMLILHPFGAFVERLVPGKEEEIVYRSEYLGGKLPDDTPAAVGRIESELRNMLSNARKAVDDSEDVFSSGSDQVFRRLIRRESLNDFLDDRIGQAIVELSSRPIGQKEASRLVLLGRLSNALEQFTDITAGLGYVGQGMHESDGPMAEEGMDDLRGVYAALRRDAETLARDFPGIKPAGSDEMRRNDSAMRETINSAYSRHLARLRSGHSYKANVFEKSISRLESAHSRLHVMRKLAESYSRTD